MENQPATKPKPKPFPKLPEETPEQRAALATIGPFQIVQAQAWVDGIKYVLDPTSGKDGKIARFVEDPAATGMVRAMLNAEDAG